MSWNKRPLFICDFKSHAHEFDQYIALVKHTQQKKIVSLIHCLSWFTILFKRKHPTLSSLMFYSNHSRDVRCQEGKMSLRAIQRGQKSTECLQLDFFSSSAQTGFQRIYTWNRKGLLQSWLGGWRAYWGRGRPREGAAARPEDNNKVLPPISSYINTMLLSYRSYAGWTADACQSLTWNNVTRVRKTLSV